MHPTFGYVILWKTEASRNIRGYARNRKSVSLIDDVVMGPYIDPQEAVS
jgi:hypothetical protein